jgi:hypothetical protein
MQTPASLDVPNGWCAWTAYTAPLRHAHTWYLTGCPGTLHRAGRWTSEAEITTTVTEGSEWRKDGISREGWLLWQLRGSILSRGDAGRAGQRADRSQSGLPGLGLRKWIRYRRRASAIGVQSLSDLRLAILPKPLCSAVADGSITARTAESGRGLTLSAAPRLLQSSPSSGEARNQGYDEDDEEDKKTGSSRSRPLPLPRRRSRRSPLSPGTPNPSRASLNSFVA